jgi:surface antigen
MFRIDHEHSRRGALALGLLLSAAACGVALADPPDWAPAHGKREKHRHRDEDHHDHDRVVVAPAAAPVVIEPRYGVLNGHCNRQALGTVLGGVAGGVVGNQTSGGDAGATAVGTIIGALLGNVAGRALDQADRGCTQQVLQYARNGEPVQWMNGPVAYVMTPGAIVTGNGRACRPFTLVAERDGQRWQEQRRACRGQDQNWYVDN